jgi:hypothetical protein
MRQLGSSTFYGVATDGDGNVYISGAGGGGALVAKYSTKGALRWTRQLGTSSYTVSHGVATDGDGNIYISGVTDGSLGGVNRGREDAFVAKYSAEGALRWTRQLGSPEDEQASSVAADAEGNVYIAGWTNGLLGGSQAGSSDAFVAKYSAEGALRWTRQLGTSEPDSANGVATDRNGNVYISGSTDGSLGGTNQGFDDAFLAKYSAEGALRWVRQLGTYSDDLGSSVATDGEGNVYISGSGSPGTSQGMYDAFVAKYSTRR